MNSKTTSLIIDPTITPTLQIPHVGSSDPEANFPNRETGSLVNHPTLSLIWSSRRRINRVLWSDSPTLGYSDYPSQLPFSVFLLHLSNLSQRSFSAFSPRLDISTLGWTPRLNGALDVSSRLVSALGVSTRRCIRYLGYDLDVISKRHKKSYKYDLTNSLVTLIALSHDHQNHSK